MSCIANSCPAFSYVLQFHVRHFQSTPVNLQQDNLAPGTVTRLEHRFDGIGYGQNSTWLVTSRHVSTRHVRRVEPNHFGCVELVEQHRSTRSTRRTYRVETSQVEFRLIKRWLTLQKVNIELSKPSSPHRVAQCYKAVACQSINSPISNQNPQIASKLARFAPYRPI